jgi:hypothetical protein
MAKGPKGEKRPADTNLRAFDIVRIASGEAEEVDPHAGKDPAAVALGRKGGLKGGKARATSLSSEKRAAIAKKAAQTRWRK